MKTLKAEEVYIGESRTVEDVQNRLPYFIEQMYNRKRLHSALGYQPPEEFEALWTAAQDNQPPCHWRITNSPVTGATARDPRDSNR